MNIADLVNYYIKLGYNFIDAQSKVSQDIILIKLGKTKFKEHITIKGGVVMHNISKDKRRATRDMDLDFIKYSLEDKYIISFIDSLNSVEDNVKIEIIGNIKPLHQQDYDGKRVNIKILDNFGYVLKTKIDIGVHKLFELEQEEYCFDFDILEENVNLLINSIEQIFTEKLKSLLKLGARSTRYKDLFDFYYLINDSNLDKSRLLYCINVLIFKDDLMREKNMTDIINRLKLIFDSNRYNKYLSNPKVNWLEISSDQAIDNLLSYLESLLTVEV